MFLVFGHSDAAGGPGPRLSAAAVARVRAVTGYVAEHHAEESPGGRPLVVFTGGRPVTGGASEGELMLRAAAEAGLGRYADLLAETRSRSTLDNLLRTVEDGLLGALDFTTARPLGLVSHDWHLPRIRILARKVLRLPGPALLDVPAYGPAGGRWSERTLRLGSTVIFLGTRDPAALRRRERFVVTSARLLRRRDG